MKREKYHEIRVRLSQQYATTHAIWKGNLIQVGKQVCGDPVYVWGVYSVALDKLVIPVRFHDIETLMPGRLYRVRYGNLYGVFSIPRRQLVVPTRHRWVEISKRQLIITQEVKIAIAIP